MNTRNSSPETSFAVGANKYRRQTLSILAEERTLSVSELTSRLTNHPSNTTTSESDETQQRKTRLELCHVHLPKLDETGLVSYAHEAAEVTVPEEAMDDLSEMTETFERLQRNESRILDDRR